MNVSAVTINQVFKTYQGQARIAELNHQNPVKRVQGQRERVSISQEAREALAAHTRWASQPSEIRKAQSKQAGDIGPEVNEATPESEVTGFTGINFV